MIPVSGVILAGGRSSRMGRDKASLLLGGKTLLELQVEKLRGLGIMDVMVSGKETSLPGTRYVPDLVPHRGPLGGLHACLSVAKNPDCLVLPVDVPLFPAGTLRALTEAHRAGDGDATLLEVDGRAEPLIALYRSSVAETIGFLLEGEDRSVRALLRLLRCRTLPYGGERELLANCNTPEEFQQTEARFRLGARGSQKEATRLF